MNAEKMATALMGVIFGSAILFCVCIASTLMGGVIGWVVGVVFENTFFSLRAFFGLQDLSMWQIGCGLGLVGSFFRTRVDSKQG